MNEINSIDVKKLKNLMDNESICLIDVREDNEWKEIHISEAIHIPKAELATKIQEVVLKPHQPIYLHCRGGMRSLEAAKTLIALGYPNVYSVEGGITAWVKEGYPTLSSI